MDELQQTASGPGEILQAKEVAAWLRCHVDTVYDLYWAGQIKGFSIKGPVAKTKRGRKGLRFLASSVRDLIASGVAESGKALRADEPPEWRPMPCRKGLRGQARCGRRPG